METSASVKTKCDGCGATLSSNSSYPNKKGAMSMYLPDGEDEQGYSKQNRYDYCSEACMLTHLQARAKANKVAKGEVTQYFSNASVVEVDVTNSDAYARYISTKKRDEMKDSDFLDPERRSFPIKNCEDVKAAPHRFGTYKGSLSTDELKSRLIRKAKEIGCESSLPKEWTSK